MDTIFTRGPSIHNRLAMALLLSAVLIIVDQKFDGFKSSRVYLNSILSPLQYIANLPSQMLNLSAERLATQQRLIRENEQLTNTILLQSEKLQRFDTLQSENAQLRELLDAPVKYEMQKRIAELMAVDKNPYSQQVLINKGAIDNVFIGQSVLDDRGIVGQIMEVGSTNSRVLLITDATHFIPVRNVRNNMRFILSGTGSLNELSIQHVPHSSDIEEGDMLVSSGLGKRFPEGYPVGRVVKVDRDDSEKFASVEVEPAARLNSMKYLLLLWPSNEFSTDNTVINEVEN